ncbi:trigger factor [Francisella tularensis subsp. novicida]|uniref:Trigger factor n=3 Tax=Pseudomonadota TaxID=1224 RepID=TIG_FRATN|nr:trigger factor [Francisella tularensis]A0Q6T0.1 RecName: Full=Trigger factor; Short=TF; AltName: Full=PPIase [Francisella tularensis subsp. novicida U112]ABK89945.1 trigger factor (TF) protein (peptidyl-prolyl cis/trans isomerase) [Francisella tularensis subsp. novicida U112]AJI60372.1 trigger factor [Francisella tularensis subsp. novicida U112]APC95071.1 trigger factor [Francisella tularensis subsp. novicida]EDX19466.1 trigger factor [Francisella tularensis subsp. novicida FTE]MBK2035654.
MQVTVEKKEGIHCSLLIEVPANEIDSVVSKEINRTAKTIKMDGFRPGKVPAGMVKKKYGEQIRMEVISDLIPQKYSKAIQDEKLAVAGIEVELKENKEGQPLKFVANLELFPEFEVTGFEKIEVQKPVVELTDKEVKQMIENLRKQFATFSEVDKAVEKDDKVTIDFVGKKDGEAFEGGTANDTDVIIGSGQMIPGFEDGIIGMKKGEQKTITVTFPQDYQNKDLAGAETTFDITVKKIQQAELPEVNDEFVKKFGVKGGVDTFENEIKENMQRELKFILQRKVKDQVFKGLREIAEFETPKSLIKREIDAAKQNLLKQMGGAKGFDVNQLPDNLFEANAKQKVETSLILDSIMNSQEFKAEEAEVESLLDELVQAYEEPEKTKEQIKKNDKEMANLKALVIENKLTDWVLEQAKVTEKTEDFFEVIKENMQAQQAGF